MSVCVCGWVGYGVVVVVVLPGCGKESITCDAKAKECMSDA